MGSGRRPGNLGEWARGARAPLPPAHGAHTCPGGGRGPGARPAELRAQGSPSRPRGAARPGRGPGHLSRPEGQSSAPACPPPPAGQLPRKGSPSGTGAEHLAPPGKRSPRTKGPPRPGRVTGPANRGACARSGRGSPNAGGARSGARERARRPPSPPPAVTWGVPGVRGGGWRLGEGAGVALRAAPRHEAAAPVLGRGHGPAGAGARIRASEAAKVTAQGAGAPF